MRLFVYSIQKNAPEFSILNEKFAKFILNYAEFKDICLFNGKINSAQRQGKETAQRAYSEALKPYKKGFCVALDENGKEFTSDEFATFLKDKNELCFFIGGAYGFERDFLAEFDLVLSLSKLTLAHHLAKILLLEQLYRGFCILNKHPYHK